MLGIEKIKQLLYASMAKTYIFSREHASVLSNSGGYEIYTNVCYINYSLRWYSPTVWMLIMLYMIFTTSTKPKTGLRSIFEKFKKPLEWERCVVAENSFGSQQINRLNFISPSHSNVLLFRN